MFFIIFYIYVKYVVSSSTRNISRIHLHLCRRHSKKPILIFVILYHANSLDINALIARNYKSHSHVSTNARARIHTHRSFLDKLT